MDIDRIVDLLGLDKVKPKGKEISARRPMHDDRNPSFSINSETGAWICYSGCGGGTIFQLVERILGIKNREAKTWPEEQGVASGWRR